MAKVTGLTYEQARAKRSELKAKGATLSTSKELGKIEDYIKTLKPQNYDARTVSSARAKLSSSTQPVGTSTAGAYGSSSAPGGIDLGGVYDQLFNTDAVRAKKDELSNIEKARDEAVTKIQNNPWFSQATRGGKIASVESDSERKLARINSELNRMQTDAQIQYNIRLQQYDINRQQYQDGLNLFNSLISAGALTNAGSDDIANLSVQLGIPSSMINSIVETSKTKNIRLQPFDDGVGQYMLALDPQGNIVNRTYLGASGSSGGVSSKSGSDYLGSTGVRQGSGAYTNVLTPPAMSATPGAQVNVNGLIWTMGSDGKWF